jgi:thioredoxin reductase
MVGIDGLLPADFRQQAWQQIQVYDSAILCEQKIVDVQTEVASGTFLLYGETGILARARHVMLAHGYHDIYPEVPGFRDCWGRTIIPCPFCDGYENRDRVWGLVASSELALEHMPKLFRNWTTSAKLIVSPHISLNEIYRDALNNNGVTVHTGEITAINHVNGQVESVTLHNGEVVEVGTLWWRTQETPAQLTNRVTKNFSLSLDENGYIKTDDDHRTQVKGLWAFGDIRGWAGALGAAFVAHQAASALIREWHTS